MCLSLGQVMSKIYSSESKLLLVPDKLSDRGFGAHVTLNQSPLSRNNRTQLDLPGITIIPLLAHLNWFGQKVGRPGVTPMGGGGGGGSL